MNKLTEIINYKQKEIEPIIPQTPKLRAAALQRNDFLGFRSALDQGDKQLGVIAEVKKASPSAGVIDPFFDPLRQARLYAEGGAQALSILTDRHFFQGSLSYLSQITKDLEIPCLRKDFIIHEAQIYEAIITGADAILLIVAALPSETLKRLYETAKMFQLDVLVEVHNLTEMEQALDLEADLIGINNRNLKTFTTDLHITRTLAEEVPDQVLLVSESGIKTTEDAQFVLNHGANAILVGESLMRAPDPSAPIQDYQSLRSDS